MCGVGLGLFGIASDILRLFGIVWDGFGFHSKLKCGVGLGLFGILWDYLGVVGSCLTVCL